MTGPGTVLWSLVCGSAGCRSRWSAACTWWHMRVRQSGAAARPERDGLDPAAVIPGVCPPRVMLTATGQDGRLAGSTGPIRRGAGRRCSPGRPPSSRPVP